MPERAQVSSVEAIESFRSRLVVFISAARPTLDEVSSDVMRARIWLETDQRVYWEAQLKKRQRAYEEAQQSIFSTRLSSLHEEVSAAQQMTARRAKAALDEAQNKLRLLKQWERQYDSLVEPLVKQMEKLQTVLSHDMPMAVAHLAEVIRLLQDYADLSRPIGSNAPPPPPTSTSDDSTSSVPPAGLGSAPDPGYQGGDSPV
ncbi:MAG: hypothetical protein HYR88_11115 [Verrucomicrobia bacterium]|nr:hypothetical protein [Verrucomicrobiota bacterium]MBI3869453.1 hypothetical protein [Verrucomicrobiota bacterium]